VGESRVLVLDKDLERDQVWGAVVVDEPSDVAVLVGVDAVRFTTILLQKKNEHYLGIL
jgi:hypothetical protein